MSGPAGRTHRHPPCPHGAILGQRWAEVQEAVQSAGAAGRSWPRDRPGRRGPRPQGLQRRLWLSAPEDVAGAARLLRWWGKVGMSSGSQAAGRGLLSAGWGGPPTPPSAPLLALHAVPAARAARACSGPTAHLPNSGPGPDRDPSQALARGWGRLTQGLLLEVGALQAVASCRPGEKALPFMGPGPSPSHLPRTADSWVAGRDRGPRNRQEPQKGLHDLGGQRPRPHRHVWEGPSQSRRPCPPAGRVSTFSWGRT